MSGAIQIPDSRAPTFIQMAEMFCAALVRGEHEWTRAVNGLPGTAVGACTQIDALLLAMYKAGRLEPQALVVSDAAATALSWIMTQTPHRVSTDPGKWAYTAPITGTQIPVVLYRDLPGLVVLFAVTEVQAGPRRISLFAADGRYRNPGFLGMIYGAEGRN